jgi:two-component sensor histidine kinase
VASDLLLAEFIHRSANDFAVACAEIRIASRMPSLSATHERLQRVVARLNALASIQRMLQPPRVDVIDLGNALCELCQYSAEARFAEQGAFIRLRTCEGLIDAKRGQAVLMIVSELLTNVARHAFRGPGGLVEIDAIRVDDRLLCRISDNGVGIGSDPGKRRTGSAIILELARDAGIALTISSSESGSRFELSMPCVDDGTAVTRSRN